MTNLAALLLPLALTFSLRQEIPAKQLQLVEQVTSAVKRVDLTRLDELLDAAPPGALADRDGALAAAFAEALGTAVGYNEVELVKAFLDRGMPVNARDEAGRQPIHSVQSREMLRLLLDAGADASSLTRRGDCALDSLWSVNDPMRRATAWALIDAGCPVSLDNAMRLGWVDRVEEILGGGARPSTADIYRLVGHAPPAHVHVPILELLLVAGAPVDGPPPRTSVLNWSYPEYPVLWSVYRGSFDVAVRLLQEGAIAPGPGEPGWEVIRGREVRASTEGDCLDRAVDAGHLPLTRWLLKGGYDPEVGDSAFGSNLAYRTARLNRAVWRGHEEIAALLMSVGVTGEPIEADCAATLAAAVAGRPDLHDQLVARGAPRSLHAAAFLGRIHEVNHLLPHAETGTRDDRMTCTPLGWAVLGEQIDVVEALLAAGSDPLETVPSGVSLAMLESARADGVMPSFFNRAEEHRVSVLALAVQERHWNVVDLFLDRGGPVDASTLRALATAPEACATGFLERALQMKQRERAPGWAGGALKGLAKEPGWPDYRGPDLQNRLTRTRMLLEAGASGWMSSGASVVDAAVLSAIDPVLDLILAEGPAPSLETACLLGLEGTPGLDDFMHSLGKNERDALIWKAVRAKRPGAILALLESAGDRREEHANRTNEVAAWRSPEVVQSLIDAGVIVPRVEDVALDVSGALDLLEKQIRNTPLVKSYIRGGLSLEAIERRHWTLLHDACSSKAPETIEFLLGLGLDPNRRTGDGRTTVKLLLAHARNAPDTLTSLQLLLDAGVRPRSISRGTLANFQAHRWDVKDDELSAAIERLWAPFLEVDEEFLRQRPESAR